jgi:hypothetical protein
MVSQDYLFMLLLVLSVLYFIHWGGGHSLRPGGTRTVMLRQDSRGLQAKPAPAPRHAPM